MTLAAAAAHCGNGVGCAGCAEVWMGEDEPLGLSTWKLNSAEARVRLIDRKCEAMRKAGKWCKVQVDDIKRVEQMHDGNTRLFHTVTT